MKDESERANKPIMKVKSENCSAISYNVGKEAEGDGYERSE
jgi:hypothetical protein